MFTEKRIQLFTIIAPAFLDIGLIIYSIYLFITGKLGELLYKGFQVSPLIMVIVVVVLWVALFFLLYGFIVHVDEFLDYIKDKFKEVK